MENEEKELLLAVKELQAFIELYGGTYYGGQNRILKEIIEMLELTEDFPEKMDFIRRDYGYLCDSRYGISEFIVWKDDANERVKINRRITELDHTIKKILWNRVYDENGMLISGQEFEYKKLMMKGCGCMINKKHIIFLTLIVACFLVSPAYAEVNQPIALQETTQDLSGEGWNWDASKKILTLDGLQYEDTTKEYSAAITLPADATIILQDGSVNTISTQRMIGIECYGNLTVRGKGRLEIKMDAADVEEEPLRTWKYINLEKSSWDAVNGILINGDGDFSLQSSTLAISGVEYGIYFSALGGYEQQDGSLTIEGEKYKKSRGIQASFGTVQCNGKLEITTSDFGVACLFFWVDKNGDAKIKHQGEKYSGRAGIYAGPGLEWKTGAEVESLVMGVSISGGNLIVDDWEKGICIKGMGSYNQKDGIVKATNQKEYGLYVQGGEKVQGNVSVTGGILEAQGETAAIAVIIPKNIESEKQYINIENISEQENSYKTLSSKQTIDGIKTDAVILSEKNNELAKEVRIQCGNYQLSPLKNTINIYVNESLLTLEDGRSYIDGNNRTMVPVRALATAMGMNTEWADASKKVSLSDNAGNEIILTLNKTDYVINGETKIMDTAAVSLPPGRIYVPLRFVVEAFNGEIEYVVDENKTQNIFITTASR